MAPGPDDERAPNSKRKRADTYYDDQDVAGLQALAEKDDLTVMVRSLHPRAGEFDLFEQFSKVGKVNDVKLISDERGGRSIGVAYVEMADAAGAEAALGLTGTPIMGSALVVQRSLGVKNRLASQGATAAEIAQAGRVDMASAMASASALPSASAAAAAAASAAAAVGKSLGIKVYVGGLDFAFSEPEIESIFSKFGPLEAVHLQRDMMTQASKGFAFIHFKDADDGLRCCKEMDGTTLASRAIKVNVSGTQGSHQMPQPQMLPQLNAAAAAAAGFNSSLVIGNSSVGDPNAVSALDGLDTDGKGGGHERINASQRANLLMKLASSAGLDVPDSTRKAAAQTGYAVVAPGAVDLGGSDSRCVVLKNMFDRLSEEVGSNPNFFAELADDVRGEAARLGTVLFCSADKWSNGFVYIKMLANAEATRVLEVMDGRYFAKNKIMAAYIPEQTLDKKFNLAGIGLARGAAR